MGVFFVTSSGSQTAKVVRAEWNDQISLSIAKNIQGKLEADLTIFRGCGNRATTRLTLKQLLKFQHVLSDVVSEIVFGPTEDAEDALEGTVYILTKETFDENFS